MGPPGAAKHENSIVLDFYKNYSRDNGVLVTVAILPTLDLDKIR